MTRKLAGHEIGVLQDNNGERRLLASWLLLALGALALSTVYAVLVVLTRTPLLNAFAGTRELFRNSLVLHVNFAVVVWLLVCAAALWTLAAGGAGRFRWAALMLACCGAAAMAIAPWFGTPLAVLSNYVPVLDSRLFLSGLSVFIAGIVLAGAASVRDMLRQLRAGRYEAWRLGVILSVIAAAMALASLLASIAATGAPVNQAGYEALFWGPGHVLQFVHVLLMMTAWIVLGERILGRPLAPPRWLLGLLLLAALPVLAAPLIHIFYAVGSPDFRRANTLLMTLGLWPAAALLAARIVLQLARAGRGIWAQPETLPLVLSLLLFALGCIFGAAIQGETTLVTAHYHGTVGAVTLAYMGLGYHLLAAFGFSGSTGRLARWQLLIYGSGLLVLASSLAWLGTMGVPRKTPHVDQAAQTLASTFAMGGMSLGGLLSLVGIALFVFVVGRSIWPQSLAHAPRRDVRARALLLTAAAVIAGGLLVATLDNSLNPAAPNAVEEVIYPAAIKPLDNVPIPAQSAPQSAPALAANVPTDAYAAHAREKNKAEIERRFQEGVLMLRAMRYDDAAAAFHHVLRLAPDLPEANVNMGFVQLGLERYAAARDFFNDAIALRGDQVNAYYGLAFALEGQHDLPEAIGAMRTYQHLVPADDPSQEKAGAKIKEWEERRDQQRGATRTEQ